ncbi:MAG: hypothetical protein JWP04_2663 [Belnapia sp.]|nr:hypothetical protein [Belnapia sp.]
MTQDSAAGRTPALARAIDRYCGKFGRDQLPCLYDTRGDAEAVAAALLDHAVAVGRPLRYAGVAEALGKPAPPVGGAM